MARLYNAGVIASNFDKAGRVYSKLDSREKELRNSYDLILESYHYVGKESYVKKIRKEGVKIFLDSGAFTAYTQNAKIDIGKYCDYCHRNKDIIEFPSVLDVIDFNNKDVSIKGTYRNQMDMEQRFKAAGTYFDATGYAPLPAVHYGEPDEVVQHYADNYKYIALGGLVPISTPQMILWLDHIFERFLCNADGTPRVKVHGFGVTSLPIMQRYPWYSVDSSTWVMWSVNGMILLPKFSRQLNISSRSSARKVKGQHIDNIVPPHHDFVEAYISSLQIDSQRLRDVVYARWAWNYWAFPSYLEERGFAESFTRQQMTVF